MIGELIAAGIILFLFALYAIMRAGAREDEMKERLLKRITEERKKRGQNEKD